VALAEGRALELPGPDFGDVVRQLGSHCILQVYFFEHVRFPSLFLIYLKAGYNVLRHSLDRKVFLCGRGFQPRFCRRSQGCSCEVDSSRLESRSHKEKI
jgi:hypothetical protein